MKICRFGNFPTTGCPGKGLNGYYLSTHLGLDTLYVTELDDRADIEVPPHVHLHEVRTRDKPTTPKLRRLVFDNHSNGILRQLRITLRAIASMRGVPLFLGSMRAIGAFRPDLVAIHGNVHILPGLLSKWMAGARLAASFHGAAELKYLESVPLLRILVGQADLLTAVNPAMVERLAALYPGREVYFVPTGVDLCTFRATKSIDERRRAGITIGRLTWEKGYPYLLEGIALALDTGAIESYTIVGDGPDANEVEQEIRALGIGRAVRLVRQQLSRNEIMEELNDHSFFVLASVMEGLPKVILESLACGLPVVTTEGCKLPEDLVSSIEEVPERDSGALGEAMIRLAKDREHLRAMATKGLKAVQAYDWRSVATRLRPLYEKTVSGTSSDSTKVPIG